MIDFSLYEIVDCRDSNPISECVKIDTHDSFERIVVMHRCGSVKINGSTVFKNSIYVPHEHKSGKTRITIFDNMYVVCDTSKIDIYSFDGMVKCLLQTWDNATTYFAPKEITIRQRLYVEAQRRSEVIAKLVLIMILYRIMVWFARYISNRLYS